MQPETSSPGRKSFGQIIGSSFETYFGNIEKYIAIAALAIVPVALCSGGLWALGDFTRTAADGWSSDTLKWMVTDLLFPLGTFLLTTLAYPLVNGALIHATEQKRLEQPMSIRQAYLAALRHAGRLIGTWLLTEVLIVLMMASLICFPLALVGGDRWLFVLTAVLAIGLPFGLYFSVKWLLVLQTVMLEESRTIQSLSRSGTLVTGNWWRSLGVWVVLSVAPAFILGIPASILLASWEDPNRFAVTVIQGGFPALLVVPLSTIAQTLLYFDLRAREAHRAPQVVGGGVDVPPAPKVELSPQTPATGARQPRKPRLKPVLIAITVAMVLAAVITPTVLYYHNRADAGEIQVFVKSLSTGKRVDIGHGNLKTLDYTNFAFVVDFNASVRVVDENNTIIADVKPGGGDYWEHSRARVGVFAVKETKDHFLANGLVPERDPANEVSTTVEILDEKHILVSPTAGEFPSESQLVLWLDYGGGSGWCARLFTL